MSEFVEVLGPSGLVHFHRPASDPIIIDALETPGYAVRWPGRTTVGDLAAMPALRKATITQTEAGLIAACSRTQSVPCTRCGAVHLRRHHVHCDY